mmetsp:Transcript_4121/g.8876  ORF Transcript_4121/g.8876 Transcript_4121/m.8876 type:complete len:251 (+) Transcript_4121:2720-3472(+)
MAAQGHAVSARHELKILHEAAGLYGGGVACHTPRLPTEHVLTQGALEDPRRLSAIRSGSRPRYLCIVQRMQLTKQGVQESRLPRACRADDGHTGPMWHGNVEVSEHSLAPLVPCEAAADPDTQARFQGPDHLRGAGHLRQLEESLEAEEGWATASDLREAEDQGGHATVEAAQDHHASEDRLAVRRRMQPRVGQNDGKQHQLGPSDAQCHDLLAELLDCPDALELLFPRFLGAGDQGLLVGMALHRVDAG